jgi:two-component system, LytTR family, response regulator
MPPPWRIAIVDEEPMAMLRLRRMLLADPHVELVGESTDGPDALAMVHRTRPDILFLDIQIPGFDGLTLVQEITADQAPALVFVTAFENFAVRAFEAQAVDYLLKPVSEDRVKVALTRAKAAVANKRTDLGRILQAVDELRVEQETLRGMIPRHKASLLERLLVKVEGRTVVLPVREIDWIESSANYVKVHVGNQSFYYRETLSNLAEELDPGSFARIHRSTIANLDRIREIQPWFSGDGMVVLRNGTKLRMSRSYRRDVEMRLGSLRTG